MLCVIEDHSKVSLFFMYHIIYLFFKEWYLHLIFFVKLYLYFFKHSLFYVSFKTSSVSLPQVKQMYGNLETIFCLFVDLSYCFTMFNIFIMVSIIFVLQIHVQSVLSILWLYFWIWNLHYCVIFWTYFAFILFLVHCKFVFFFVLLLFTNHRF